MDSVVTASTDLLMASPFTEGKTLLVAIPCLNEAETIAKVIGQIPTSIVGIGRIDILVVDDGSTDDTAEKARLAGAMVHSHGVNRGVGAAFQSAVVFAVDHSYDVMINIDGDGQFDPQDIHKLVPPVLEGKADMVTASRFKDRDLTPDMPRVKLMGNHMMSWLISRLVRKKFADVSCGFRCYGREALLQINLHGAFTYTQETFLDFAAKNIRIMEVPVIVRYFGDRKSRVASSILKYAMNTATIIFWSYRDYFPLRFFLGIALAFAVPSLAFGALFAGRFLLTGEFKGYYFAGSLSAFLMILAMLFVMVGIVADMLDRVRCNQDRILYLLRKQGSLARRQDPPKSAPSID